MSVTTIYSSPELIGVSVWVLSEVEPEVRTKVWVVYFL